MWETSNVRASLSVTGEKVDPAAVSSLLGSPPDTSRRIGDSAPGGPDGRPVPTQGHWGISSEGRVPIEEPLSRHVQSLLNRVTSRASVWQELTDEHSCRIFVGWFMEQGNEVVGLDPELLGAIAERHLRLDFDVYWPDESTQAKDL